jgi:periplasmic protein TonB
MKYFILIALLGFSANAFSQTDTTTYGYVNGTLIQTEIPPTFPGGEGSWKRFLEVNLLDLGIPGKVTVAFTVNIDGKTSDYAVVNSSNPELNNAAIRLMKKSKIWVPAVQNGKQVKYRNRVEIKFP